MASDTSGYSEIYSLLRTRILTFVAPGGATWATLSGAAVGVGNDARVWQDVPPVGVSTWPYAVIRLVNDVTSGPYQERIRFDLEVMIYGRPRTQMDKVRDLADLVDGALKQYSYSGVGFLRITGRMRNVPPPGSGDADAEVVSARLLFSGFAWPRFLTVVPT